jgi:hypothetical protein
VIINRAIFLSSLEKCLPGVDTGNISIEGADTFHFHKNTITTANNLITVNAPFAFPEPIDIFVKALDFYNLIKRLSAVEIDLALKNDRIIVKAGKAKATLAPLTIKQETFSIQDAWKPLSADFIPSFELCYIPLNKSQMAGIFVNSKGIYSTDRIKINYVPHTCKDMTTFWINDIVIKAIIKYKDFSSFQYSDGLVGFRTDDGLEFIVKRLNDESYPIKIIENYMLIAEQAGDRLDVPDELSDAITRAIPMADIGTITLDILQDKIVVSSEKDTGIYEEEISYSGGLQDAVKIRVSCNHLLYGIKRGSHFKVLQMERGKDKFNTLIIYSDKGIHLINTLQE